MSKNYSNNKVIALAALFLLAVGNLIVTGAQAARDDATVVVLTQTGCQFVESERGTDHRFMPKSADDCNAINTKTGENRLAAFQVGDSPLARHAITKSRSRPEKNMSIPALSTRRQTTGLSSPTEFSDG